MIRPKPHLIVTASDQNCGDFLINHWLTSLQDNVNLTNIDIVVLDYGLGQEQRKRLEDRGVTCFPCNNQAIHIVWARFRDISRYLHQKSYDQVLAVDGGDLIFQSDISQLFLEHQEQWRAVGEEFDSCFHDFLIKRDDFTKETWDLMHRYLKGRPIINNGFILGPARKFEALWPFLQAWSISMNHMGAEQFLWNYYVYQHGFIALDKQYNLVLMTTRRSSFFIKNGVFYDRRGEIIPVVHNAGGKEGLMRNFGYGIGRNQLNSFQQIRCHTGLAMLRFYKKIVEKI